MRTTRTTLQQTLERLARKGVRLRMEYAYGRPRLETLDGSRYVSPRLPAGQLANWLDGFEAALEESRRLIGSVIDEFHNETA